MSVAATRSAATPPLVPPASPAARARLGWLDRFLGSDPGLNRFRNALLSVLSIAVILLAEWVFVGLTHAMQIRTPGVHLPAAQAAVVATANHEYLVIAMMLGAIIGMMSGFGVMDPSAKGQLVSMLFLPVPMIAALALGIALGSYRIAALCSFAVLWTVGTYCRRFGPRGFLSGALLFMGDFFGFFLHGAVTMGDMGWLAAEIGVGLVVAIAVRFVFFYPRQTKALARIQASYSARARKLAALALELFDDPEHDERDIRRMRRQLVRLNEAALMIDAQLGDPASVADGSSAALLHQRLFDVELALTNVSRFAQAMARLDLPEDQRAAARSALLALVRLDAAGAKEHAERLFELLRAADSLPPGGDPTVIVVPHRFAGSVVALADAGSEWMALGAGEGASQAFRPAVLLFGGWLPGSSQVSATASLEPGTRYGERIRLAAYTRTAIQMGVATGGAIALGDLVSGRRFYWALIAAFITFMGANNAHEQVRKALLRVVGTFVGIIVGSLAAHELGNHTYGSIAVILVALFFGFYLMRISYAFMVVGITVMVSLLYVQLDEFSNSLLLLRLAETSVGAGVAIAVTLLVLPLRTRRVLGIALREHVRAVAGLAERAGGHLIGEPACGETDLRGDARAVDAAYQALVATTQSLRRNMIGSLDEETGRVVRLATASRNYSRNLVVDVNACGVLDGEVRRDVERAGATLRDSLAVVADAATGKREHPYVRSSALFDRVERCIEQGRDGAADVTDADRLAIRDLKLIDGVMAGLAEVLGVGVTDYDTVGLTRATG